MATKQPEQSTRDRAIFIVRGATLGGLVGAFGLTWVFSNLAEAYFSGKQPAPPAPPTVPVAAAPVQKAPTFVTTVVHHPYVAGYVPGTTTGGGTTAPAPPAGGGPVTAPAPPPPPACVSTPSKPC